MEERNTAEVNRVEEVKLDLEPAFMDIDGNEISSIQE